MHNTSITKWIFLGVAVTIMVSGSLLVAGCESSPKEAKKQDEVKKFVGTDPSPAELERRRVAEENAMKAAPVQAQAPGGPSASQAELREKFEGKKNP